MQKLLSKRIETFDLSKHKFKRMAGNRMHLSKDALPVQQIVKLIMRAWILKHGFSIQLCISMYI